MKTINIVLVFLSFFLFFTGCNNDKNNETDNGKDSGLIIPVPIAQGELQEVSLQEFPFQNQAIKTQEELDSLINAMNAVNNVNNNFAERYIDFLKYQVIAIFDKVHDNGGWSIDISDITEYPDSIVVTSQNLKKGNATSMITQPYIIAKIPVLNKKIVFKSDCDKSEISPCNVDNPLTDLPWLKAKVDEITLLFQSNPLHIAIYQCTYGNGQTGFLEDRGNVAFFYNCEGETLCIMGGEAGETCSELNIVRKELIWETNYPIEIPVTEYSLAETSCQWKRVSNGINDTSNIMIINSNEELENYIECSGESSYPEIDFSKYTLLLAQGMFSTYANVISYSLQQLSEQSYEMKVDFRPSNLFIVVYWQVPIIVNKLREGSTIELVLTAKI